MNDLAEAGTANYPLNCWYVAGTTNEVGRTMISRQILGRQVVLFRQASESIAALEDRCPHCSLPLSRGRLVGDDVVCAYHGITFSADGQCVRVPSQEQVPYGAEVPTFTVREEPPFVWIWTGEAAGAGLISPPRLPWLSDPSWTNVGGIAHVDANYLLLHDNALDLTHFPFVHGEASPYGYLNTPPPKLEIEVTERSVSYSRTFPPARLVEWQARATGLPGDQDFLQREWGTFVSPAVHIDHMDVLTPQTDGGPGAYEKVFIRAFTPEAPGSTHVFWRLARNYALRDVAVGEHLARMHQHLMTQDTQLLEDIQPKSFSGHRAMSVTADIASDRARHIVQTMLDEEQGRSAIRPGYSDLDAGNADTQNRAIMKGVPR